MYIDFHIHAFDDKIAEKAIAKLEKVSEAKAYSDGTVNDAVRSLVECNVDLGVLLPIATKPAQQGIINDWAKSINSDRIVSFATVHPDALDVYEELDRIKGMGFRGIKLHPDYQNFFVDEERMISIYKKCANLVFLVVFHEGFDLLSPDSIHSTPGAFKRVFDVVPDMTAVLAHLGGMNMWDDVEKYLCGTDGKIYFDTAFIGGSIDPVQCKRIIKSHGANRILLASDFPWHTTLSEIEFIRSLNLSQEENENIFYKNAQKLLGII